MKRDASSLLIDGTQARDLHSGVARRLTSLWPHVIRENPQIRFGLATYEFMAESLSVSFPGIEIHHVRDFGLGPSVRHRQLNPRLNEIRVEHDYEWLHQDGFVVASGKTLTTIHDVRQFDPMFSPWWRRMSAGHMLRRLSRSPWPVITVSQYSRQALGRFLPQGPGQIEVVANGVEPARFQGPIPGDILGDLGLMAGQFRLFVGHLEKRKNIPFLIELQRRLRQEDPEATLVVATHLRGDSAESQSLKAQIESESTAGVVVCDNVSDEVLGTLYRHASCFLLPSILEGFSITPLEALALGTPVVVSDIGAHQEVLAGDVCFPLDIEVWLKAVRAAEDVSTRQERLNEGQAIASRWTWKAAAASMTPILRGLEGQS